MTELRPGTSPPPVRMPMRRVFIPQRCHTASRSLAATAVVAPRLDKQDQCCPESPRTVLRRRLNSPATAKPMLQEREQFAGYLRAQGLRLTGERLALFD